MSPFHVELDQPYAKAKAAFICEFQRRYVAAVLAKTGGNVSAAARVARADPSAFRRLMRVAEVPPRRGAR